MPYAEPLLNSNLHQHTQHLLQSGREAVVRLLGPQNIVTAISHQYSPERSELEAFVRDAFAKRYAANIKHLMPLLMSLRDDNGHLLAVCGIRHASETPLFLEQYLTRPIERALAGHVGIPVLRHQIVEVGNFAAADPLHVRSLLASISLYLHKTSSEWAVFTGIPALKNSLIKLNMQPETLGEAKLTDLPADEQADWGSYYDLRPQVMAIQR